jgi:hypothetical protein
MGKAENAVTKSVVEFLTVNGAEIQRVQTGVIPSHGRYIHCAQTGTADLLGSFRGYAIAIEMKAPNGKPPTDEQQDFEHRWRMAGGVYVVARSVDDVRWLLRLPDRRVVDTLPA